MVRPSFQAWVSMVPVGGLGIALTTVLLTSSRRTMLELDQLDALSRLLATPRALHRSVGKGRSDPAALERLHDAPPVKPQLPPWTVPDAECTELAGVIAHPLRAEAEHRRHAVSVDEFARPLRATK